MNADTIRKIKGLLAKEGAQGTTPAEVAAAVAMATRLMEREGITQAMLEIEGRATQPAENVTEFQTPLHDGGRQLASWRARLGTTLARSRGCFLFFRGAQLILVGRPTQADEVRYLFAYCEAEIERLTRAQAKGEGRTYANNFRLGCVQAIGLAIRAEQARARDAAKAEAQTSTALVLVNQAIAKVDEQYQDATRWANQMHKFGTRSMGGGRGHASGRAAGLAAGAGIYPGAGSRRGLGSGPRGLLN